MRGDYVRCRWPHNGQAVEGPVLFETAAYIMIARNGDAVRIRINKASGVEVTRTPASRLTGRVDDCLGA
jgi:hypothetical protein